MTEQNLDFSSQTKLFGNDVAALIQTYSQELIKLPPLARGVLSEAQIKLILIAYTTSKIGIVFASFKDRELGKNLWRLFMEELSEVSLSTGNLDALGDLTASFHEQLLKNPVEFDQFVLGIYTGAANDAATREELIWVKNFIRAIDNIYRSYSAAAEKFGFF